MWLIVRVIRLINHANQAQPTCWRGDSGLRSVATHEQGCNLVDGHFAFADGNQGAGQDADHVAQKGRAFDF